MNTQLFTLALLEILLSLIITVVIIFVSYKILKRFFFNFVRIFYVIFQGYSLLFLMTAFDGVD